MIALIIESTDKIYKVNKNVFVSIYGYYSEFRILCKFKSNRNELIACLNQKINREHLHPNNYTYVDLLHAITESLKITDIEVHSSM